MAEDARAAAEKALAAASQIQSDPSRGDDRALQQAEASTVALIGIGHALLAVANQIRRAA